MSYSIRSRLTLSYAGVMAAALIAVSAAGLWAQARWGREQFDSELGSLGAAVARVMQEEIGESGDLQKAVAETRASTNVPGRATAILDVHGRPLGAHWHGFVYRDLPLTVADYSTPHFATVNQGGVSWRILFQREPSTVGDYLIVVAGPLEQLAHQQHALLGFLLVLTPAIVLMTTAVCWAVASAALGPVRRMAAQAERITGRSGEQRLEVPETSDELSQLADAFNRLLDRLGAALQLQRQFMADASHQLRTPVSVIRTAAEVTLERDVREGWEYREALTMMAEQSARLGRIVGDMLSLARADAGGYRLAKRPLYLDEVAAESVRAASVLAAARNLRIATDLQADVAITGDERLLQQLVTNLLDNAVQYTPPGGSITVALAADENSAVLTVSDSGAGVPIAERERIFDRFVRLDPARAAASGAGLGLPIARWIAEQHGGTLIVEDDPAGGTRFVFRVPVMNLR